MPWRTAVKILIIAVLAGTLLPSAGGAIGQEFIPLDHWSYEALERLQALGLCVLPEDRPFTRLEFVQIVTEVARMAHDVRLGPRDRYNLARLEKEFTAFTSQRDPQYRYDPPTLYLLDSPLVMEGDIDVSPSLERMLLDTEDEVFLNSNPTFKVHAGERVTFDVRYRLRFGPEHGDRARGEKPSRRERSFKGLTSLYERGYVVAAWDKLHVYAGRDHLDWGSSDWGNLITPGGAHSLDMVGMRVRLKMLRLSLFHGQLSPTSRRYLAGHRLEGRWGSTVVGVSETVVYAGKDFDPVYSFPLSSYYANQYNERGNDDNIYWSVDAKTSLLNHLTLYGSILIDDAQFERDGVNPDKLAFDIGGRLALSYPVEATVRTRYRYVDIFTYTHRDSLTSYVSGEGDVSEGDIVLGGEPGPDTESWRLDVEAYPRANTVARVFAYVEGRGEGNDLRPHVPPADPNPGFPSGIVQRTRAIGAEFRWEFDRNRWVSGAYSHAWLYNISNIPGLDDTTDSFRVLFHWEFI